MKFFNIKDVAFLLPRLMTIKALLQALDLARLAQIIDLLSEGKKDVQTLQIATRLGQSISSQYLKKLRNFNLVSSNREGKRIIYTLNKKQFAKVLTLQNQLGTKGYKIIRAICHKERIAILQYIADHPKTSMKPIWLNLNLDQSRVSVHARILEETGLLINKKDGQNKRTRVNQKALRELKKAVDQYYTIEVLETA
jgi:DNA-binding transcriptional ArsR family regulator